MHFTIFKKYRDTLNLLLTVLFAFIFSGHLTAYFFPPDNVEPTSTVEETTPQESKQETEVDKTKEQTTVQTKGQTTEEQSKTDQDIAVVRAGIVAKQTFETYHEAITKKQYRTAYNMLTPELQTQMGSYDDFMTGFSSTISSKPEGIKVTSSTLDSATLEYKLVAKDRVNGIEQTQRYKGNATLVKVGDIWRISSVSAQKE